MTSDNASSDRTRALQKPPAPMSTPLYYTGSGAVFSEQMQAAKYRPPRPTHDQRKRRLPLGAESRTRKQ